ncbi:hypothetical protein MTYP_00901 [Methylophilaceae bacterium]|nr:hypothetical protein MTYP_00901 [Methylophilaceae bacterium]
MVADNLSPEQYQFQFQPREQEARQAYFAFLQRHGATAKQLNRREQLLNGFCVCLSGIDHGGHAYREAVDEWLKLVDKSKWPTCLSLVREFFPFWMQNVKEIAMLADQHDSFDLEQAQWASLQGDFASIWLQMEQACLTEEDQSCLESYRDALSVAYVDEKIVETRVKLAKLLLVRLKSTSNRIPRIYRKAVDATVPVFELKEMRWLFIEVVREFFYFWKQQ